MHLHVTLTLNALVGDAEIRSRLAAVVAFDQIVQFSVRHRDLAAKPARAVMTQQLRHVSATPILG